MFTFSYRVFIHMLLLCVLGFGGPIWKCIIVSKKNVFKVLSHSTTTPLIYLLIIKCTINVPVNCNHHNCGISRALMIQQHGLDLLTSCVRWLTQRTSNLWISRMFEMESLWNILKSFVWGHLGKLNKSLIAFLLSLQCFIEAAAPLFAVNSLPLHAGLLLWCRRSKIYLPINVT